MRDLASDASKKAVSGDLRKKYDQNMENVLRNKGVREKLRLRQKN